MKYSGVICWTSKVCDKELVDIVKLVSDMESSPLSYQIIMVISIAMKKMVGMFLFIFYIGGCGQKVGL
jgi:hypothetical protein